MAAGIDNVNARLWQVSGSTTWPHVMQFQAEPINDNATIPHVGFNAANQLITGRGLLKVWNPADGTFVRNMSHFTGQISGISYGADGQSAAVASPASSAPGAHALHLLNAADGSPLVSFPQSAGLGIYQMGMTPDAQRIVTVDGFDNRHYVKVWNATDGSLIRNTEFSYGGFLSLAVSPDGQSYVLSGMSSSVNGAVQYRVSDGGVVRTLNPNNSCIEKTLAFSPDGQTLATTRASCNDGSNGLTFYTVSTGAVLRRIPGLPGGEAVNAGAFSPDGLTFAVTSGGGNPGLPSQVYLFRVSDGETLQQFSGHTAMSQKVAFSPDGRTLASTSIDKTVRLWRVSDAALLQTYDAETHFAWVDYSAPIRFSPDGQTFIYGRTDATVVAARNPYAPVQVTLAPIADAYVRGATPTANYGTVTELQVKRTYTPGNGKGRQTYMRFDTSTVTGTITRAKLRVYARLSAVTQANANIPLAVFPVSTAWDELTLTWANKPAPNVPAELGRVIVTDATARWYEFDITNFINQERAAGRAVTGVLLRNMLRGESGDYYTLFNSREATSNQPVLVIDR